MDNNMKESHRSGLDTISVLFGFAAGVIGTIVFATYKQREFDGVITKSRSLAGQADGFVEDMGENARRATSDLARSAHQTVDKVDHVTHRAIDKIEKAVTT